MSWNSYSEYLEEWERFEASKDLYNELRFLVIRINYNKRLLSSKTWTPSRKDIIIHKERFEEYLEIFNEIDYKLKLINYNYFSKRLKTIKKSIVKIKNYDTKRTTKQTLHRVQLRR
tara:strand:+ start:124 stop:471 length:348 start_codon:yes stop_codon:yes gene_type:complete